MEKIEWAGSRNISIFIILYAIVFISWRSYVSPSDGLISYNTHDGDLRGSNDALKDLTYDGHRRGNTLSGGLGQLSDGETGHTNFNIDATGSDRGGSGGGGVGERGGGWVGRGGGEERSSVFTVLVFW